MANSPHSLALISAHFLPCVQSDSYPEGGGAFGGFKSIRDYFRQIAAGAIALSNKRTTSSAEVNFGDLKQTLSHLAELSIKTETGDHMRIGSLLRTVFCVPAVTYFSNRVALVGDSSDQATLAWQEMGAGDWPSWCRTVQAEREREELASALYEMMMATIGDKPIMDFFVYPDKLGNSDIWDKFGTLAPKKSRFQGSAHVGDNIVQWWVSEVDMLSLDSVVGIEWRAVMSAAGEPVVAVEGAAYVFERVDGQPEATRSDLMMAAGIVSDNDLQFVDSFFKQHDDAEVRIATGDLCFVTTWKRRPGTHAGLGAQALLVVLQELRGKYKHLSNAVFDIRPGQFLSWGEGIEVPAVEVAKQTAIENLTAYIAGLALPGWTISNIFTSADWNPFAAMLAIGKHSISETMDRISRTAELQAELDEQRLTDGGVGRPLLSFTDHEGELIDLFDEVGLRDLSMAIEDGIAVDADIEIALKAMLFGQRIHYVPLNVASGITVDLLASEYEGLPDEFDDAFDAFEAALPTDISVTRVFDYTWEEARTSGVPECVVEVECFTPFGKLYEFYTLIPLPRHFNLSRWMADTYMPKDSDAGSHHDE